MYFITGSSNKFAEAKAIIPDLQQAEIDLPELQEIDPYKIIEAKLKAGFQELKAEVVVEDTSLYFDGMNGLPGTLIKWFIKTIGNQGLVKLASVFGDKATAKTIVGYTKDGLSFEYFEGTIAGKIVEPRGEHGFAWDPIFEVIAVGRTFGQMDMEEKNQYSMRRIAFEKLQQSLTT